MLIIMLNKIIFLTMLKFSDNDKGNYYSNLTTTKKIIEIEFILFPVQFITSSIKS